MSQERLSGTGFSHKARSMAASKGFEDGAGMGSQFNHTQSSLLGGTSHQSTANLKGKLASLEEIIGQLNQDLNLHKKEVAILKSEKETLESVLTVKTQDVRKTLTNELFRVEEEMKRHYAHQKAENSRLQ